MGDLIEEWFVREILCHEAALTLYLTRAWANLADVPDLRQEVYIRVLEAAEKSRPVAPRFFLFTVAKNLMTDRARRSRIVPIDLMQDCDSLNVLVDADTPERKAGNFEQLERLVKAFEQLPARCREVMWLRKIEDLAQKDIAERLNIAEGTVEAHLVRGMRLLTQLFYGPDTDEGVTTGVQQRAGTGQESRHDQ